MKTSLVNQKRMDRVMRWYAPARFGLFYHFGLYTGGGNATSDPRWWVPLRYKTPEQFEKDAPDPVDIARNMAANAVSAGAKYTILTVYHTCGGMCVLYPTALPEFMHKTSIDYIGPYLDEAHRAGIHPMLYIPCDCHNWDAPEVNPTVPREIAENFSLYTELMFRVFDELKERYGDKIDGFWLDGGIPKDTRAVPAYIHKLWPDAIVVGNNADEMDLDDVDFGTTECHCDPCNPVYSRPSAYRRANMWGSTTPPRNFNEDIPTPNGWWYHENGIAQEYLDDRFFLLKQMVSSLGQRGIWNFAPGIGPMISGKIEDAMKPSLSAIKDFLGWGAEAVYGTKGAEGTIMNPGYFNYRASIGYCSITTPFDNPDVFYVIVTEAPSGGKALFDTTGHEPVSVTDLRTGADIPFKMWQGVYIDGIDWSDVVENGVKVLKFRF